MLLGTGVHERAHGSLKRGAMIDFVSWLELASGERSVRRFPFLPSGFC